MDEFLRQTVFDRPVDMYIQNNTDIDFKLFKTDIYTGVITTKPSNIIKGGTKGYLKADQSGLVGPSGLVTYSGKLNNINTYVSLYWNHPVGSGRSFYCGYSIPFGTYFVVPKNNLDPSQKPVYELHKIKDWTNNEESQKNELVIVPTGHYQSITYIVQYSLGI